MKPENMTKSDFSDMGYALHAVDCLMDARCSEMFWEEGIDESDFKFANPGSVFGNTRDALGNVSNIVEGLEKGEYVLVKKENA